MTQKKRAADLRGKNRVSETDITVAEKVILLKEIDIFSDLSVAELAAIATVTKELVFPPGARVIRQGDGGETVFMMISGKVAVLRTAPHGEEMVLDTISRGGAFGEMALLDDFPRSATIRTVETSRFLILHKQEFKEIVMEYPRIALQICAVLSRRIRHLHGKIKE